MSKTCKLITMSEGKAEVLNNIFASIFTGSFSSHTSRVDGLQNRDWGRKALPTVREDQVHDHLRNLNTFKSMRPDEMYPSVLRELADLIAQPLSTIFKKTWQSSEVPGDRKNGNIAPIFRKGRKRELPTRQPHLCAWEDHATDPPRSCAKAHGGQRGGVRQPAWLHQGQVQSDQHHGLL